MRPRRAEAASEVMTLRVSPEERERLRQAAKANLQKVSDFLRDVALDAASETLDESSDDEESRSAS